ncbi:MAG: phosphoadenylyl-sulfate reductase [Steroidobacteraceae bacterium]
MSPPRAAVLRSQPLIDLDALNAEFRELHAEERVVRALDLLPGEHLLTSSFGAQAAVSLHLVTQAMPQIPVILIDTGHLFPETYRFIDEMSGRLKLNLKVYRSALSPAWQEARYGKLWEQGAEGIERYNRMNKVEPMERALRELHGATWFAGLRREQSQTRASIEPVQLTGAARYKVHPIFDWTDRDVYRYLKKHALPYHPLWEQGYVSIGDWHTTRSLRDAGDDAEATRFFGLKRECGLHETSGSGI